MHTFSVNCPQGKDWRSILNHKETSMLFWAAVFFIIALIAAVLGFGGLAAGAAGIAKVLFFIFLIAFVVSLIMGVFLPR
jgi:uncharacterized membrane protein YtjA (UPF0391 family)